MSSRSGVLESMLGMVCSQSTELQQVLQGPDLAPACFLKLLLGKKELLAQMREGLENPKNLSDYHGARH